MTPDEVKYKVFEEIKRGFIKLADKRIVGEITDADVEYWIADALCTSRKKYNNHEISLNEYIKIWTLFHEFREAQKEHIQLRVGLS